MGLYHPLEDEYYAHPYIDAEEWRDKPVRHYYVHGGFRGTEEEGKEARFCLYFPEKEQYEGRFFQYLSPAPEGENECEFKTGEEDIISFALTHGAYLMVLAPYVYAVYPQYFQDFWTKEGYEGFRPDSTEAKARLQFVTTVRELILEEKAESDEHFNNVGNSWQNTLIGNQNTPLIVLAQTPPADAYLYHCRIRVLSGDAQGKESPIDTIENGTVKVSSAYDGSNGKDALEGLKVGDQVMIDNSDALAMQTLQRHQVPDETYHVYDQYRGEEGKPLYPQLPILIGPVIAESGGGSVPCGDIHGEVIAVCSLLDESALPWHGDWYREAVRRHKGDETENCFRLYYNDNCIHGDIAEMGDDVDHVVDYLGVLHQSLMDVAAWCEKGIAPVPDTVYTLEDGQLTVPFDADDRGGLQPVVHAYVRSAGPGRTDAQSTAWGKCVRVLAGDVVEFEAQINVPGETGIVTEAAWDYEKTGNYTQAVLERSDGGKKAIVHTTHVFHTPGTWFPTIKIKSNRYGDAEDSGNKGSACA